MGTIVTKKRYAELKGRCKSTISHWISEGKITKAALLGEGARARIWVEQADIDLGNNLNPGQQYGQEYLGRPPANRSCLGR